MVAERASATESVDQQNRDNGQNSLSLFSGAKRRKPRIIFLCSNISIPQLVTITRQCKWLFWVLAGDWVNVLPNCTMGLFWGRIWTRFPTLCRNGHFSFVKSTIKIILCPLNFCNKLLFSNPPGRTAYSKDHLKTITYAKERLTKCIMEDSKIV